MRLPFLTLACLASLTSVANSATPQNIGMLLFPGFQAIDVSGPLDLINLLSWRTYLNLTILTADGLPVTTNTKLHASLGSDNSTVEEWIIPTHSFANAPPLDVLFIPGGLGNRDPSIQSSVDFVRERYPSLQYLVTVCTGSGIAARAGVLDGKNATTNKWAFYETSKLGPKTWWHAHARWIVDGNIWSSSGVSAGIDVTLSWIEHVWGSATAVTLANGLEYEWHRDPSWDPFSELKEISDVISGVTLPATVKSTPSAKPTATITITETVLFCASLVKTTKSSTSKTSSTKGTSTKSTKTSKTKFATATKVYG